MQAHVNTQINKNSALQPMGGSRIGAGEKYSEEGAADWDWRGHRGAGMKEWSWAREEGSGAGQGEGVLFPHETKSLLVGN